MAGVFIRERHSKEQVDQMVLASLDRFIEYLDAKEACYPGWLEEEARKLAAAEKEANKPRNMSTVFAKAMSHIANLGL